jgi:hypothetical protein
MTEAVEERHTEDVHPEGGGTGDGITEPTAPENKASVPKSVERAETPPLEGKESSPQLDDVADTEPKATVAVSICLSTKRCSSLTR